jgi:prepilin-type N-terminal cleavage/methylation domain-containing protein
MKYFASLKNRGDTLVEVLIAMAIMSLVLVGAYVTSSRNSAALQQSQERQQGQRLAEEQIEMLRAHGGIALSGECYDATSTEVTGAACNRTSANNSGATYTMQITGPNGTNNPSGVYTISATWTSLAAKTNGDSVVTLYYRLD